MDPYDPICYRCGKAGYKEYGYFLVQRSPDKKDGGFSFKSLLFPDGSLTLGNYYTMVLCDKCIKKESILKALILMSVVTGTLAVLFAAMIFLWTNSESSILPIIVLAALVLFAAVFLIFIIIKSRKPASVTEGENSAVKIYNRNHRYAKDGVFAMAPGKARLKFNI